MSDRGRPHNVGQALFEGLGAGLSALPGFLQQSRQLQQGQNQQSFLNRLRVEEGQRSQERLDLQRQRNENALIGEASINPNFISDLDQSLIDQRNASAALSNARREQLGQGGSSEKPLTAKNKADLLQQLFQQSVKGGRERLLGETVGAIGELGGFQQDTTGLSAMEQLLLPETKPPKNILELRSFLSQNPELAQDSAVGGLSQQLFGLGSQAHQQAFTATPDSSFATNPFVAQRVFPEVDPQSFLTNEEDFVAGGSEALNILRREVPGFDNLPDNIKVQFLNEMEAALAGGQ